MNAPSRKTIFSDSTFAVSSTLLLLRARRAFLAGAGAFFTLFGVGAFAGFDSALVYFVVALFEVDTLVCTFDGLFETDGLLRLGF